MDQWPDLIKESGLPLVADGLKFFAMNLAPKLKKMGINIDPASSKGVLAQLADSITGQFDRQSTALFATARLWDDGIIDPRDTRDVLGACLSMCREANVRTLRPNSFGVARM